ncbi:ribosomal protein L7/L12 [Streptomyces ochraceiscleroticus]|uniref:Ribosomal protein L7/L12 n=1 Tax=Streptomyces ochraceiscleroticus TaxID=47761 RepID=A0ABW1MEA7_9ACTN|nr:ribosomal protein L7/L12 [Streptomyces ochraceiscleroticus]
MDNALMSATLVILVLLLLNSFSDSRAKRLERRLRETERRLDLLLAHHGIADDRPELAEVDDLLRRDRKIEAIKRYRQLTGAGLAEAKEAVEARIR